MSQIKLCFSLLLLTAAAGCRVVQTTAELPGKAVGMVTTAGKPKPNGVDPVEIQETVLRFADEFSAGMIVGVDKLRRGTNVLDAAETLQWKIALESETSSIASGPNPAANLLDLTVFISVVRASLEEHWLPKVFGESARPMLESCRGVDANLWHFAGKVLTPLHQEELRTAIAEWRRRNPQPESVLAARAVGFASRVAEASDTGGAKPGSVFDLLMLDPLAGMDPAVREIAQSRMFAERALYVTQKMPMLVRWQTELLTLNALRLPAVQQLVSNSTQLTTSVESFARVADQLPKIVNDQREAAIQQVFVGLAAERTNLIATLSADELKLRPTLIDLRQTLDAATELTKSLDKFMARFPADTNLPAATTTNTRPFDILDYATAAKEVTMTIKELNATVNSLDKAIPQIQKAGETFESTGNRLLNRLFLVGVGLITILLAGAVFAVVIYRRLAVRKSD